MAAFLKLKPSFLKFRPLLLHQRFRHTAVIEGSSQTDLVDEIGPKLMASSGDIDPSKWKKLDARSLGLNFSMIPHASRIVIKILQSEGHDAFLVGGCVRDLLLNRIPKDFDVITTANLKEIKRKFHRAYIIGRRFPICKVHVKGSEIEVSSFDTVARHVKEKEVHLSGMSEGCDEKDFMLWRNSLLRDFTVNSLFYDPFARKVYDYCDGITDLRDMKIRTLVPAHSSFQLDCARILRGLRIAARLGFSFANDTKRAIHNLYASVKTLDKARLMMEMNYMLSYGAARSSLLLLKRFNLLELLLPFHAAYLAANSIGESPSMLMELFSKLDGVVTCDQPCDSALWVSLLAFHLALVKHPQDAIVVWTLSSLLYHGTWEEGVKAAKEHFKEHVYFAPEIRNSYDNVADDELAQNVSNFASIIRDLIGGLTDSDCLRKIMDHYPSSPCPDGVFISKNAGRAVADIFSVLVDDIQSLNKKRHNYMIDSELLRKGDTPETRYVLGRVIMDTMRAGVTQHCPKLLSEEKYDFYASKDRVEQVKPRKKPNAKAVEHHEIQNHKGRGKHRLEGPDDQHNQQTTKKQKIINEKLEEMLSCEGISNRKQQLKKGVVRDVKNLLSMYQETSWSDAKTEKHRRSEVQTPKNMPTMLKKVASTRQLQNLPPNQILYLLENEPKLEENHDAQALEDASIVNVPKVLKQHKAQAPTEMLNVSTPSDFKADEDRIASNSYRKQEKQPIMGARVQDESIKLKKKGKLSSLFR